MKLSFLLLFSLHFLSVYSTKLNYPRVLLPIFDKKTINFSLESIEKGCFKWTSSRLDLIQIVPIYDDQECSSKAIVSVITKEKHRNTAIVLAENLLSGEIIRCDVIVDVIDQLAVLTTTRELYLEEAPETFELWAQDSQGNAFTTLEGIEFNWQISGQNQQSFKGNKDDNWHQVLRFLTFSESTYHEVPKSVEKFESLGLKGYMVLLEGINTGSAMVTVRLPYPEYNNVNPVEVDIMVLANIILDPSDVHILVGDSVDFRVLQLKQGKLQEISLNNQYYLEIENSELATIKRSTATGNKLGKTSVILRDRNVPNLSSDSVKTPSPKSILTVSKADKISLNLLPHYNWVTVEGEKHEIAIDLHTHDDQKIILGSKYRVGSKFDSSSFYELSRTNNGSRIYGEAIKSGTTVVHGNFEKLKTEAEMLIYKRLEVIPPLVILPYDPNDPIKQKIQFQATGGDGSYIWSSVNPKFISISSNGLAETKFENIKRITNDFISDEENIAKFAQIKVSMARNTKISKNAEILLLAPVKLSIVSYNFETPLKDYVKIHVALYSFYNDSLLPFTLCNNLKFNLEFSNQIFHEDKLGDDLLLNNACKIFYLKADNLGLTNLKISYKFFDKILKDEVNLVVFEKLNIFNPMTNELILPIGSSRNIIYHNGPAKVYNIEAELIKNLHFDKKIIDVNEIERKFSKEKHVFTILCKQIGDVTFNFEIYNLLNTNNYSPFISQYTTKVYCVKPRFINFYTSAKIRDGCPLERRSSLMHVKNSNDNFEIDIEILDALNRKLENITSLIVNWDISSSDGQKNNDLIYTRETEEEIIEGVEIPKRDYLKSSMSNADMNLKIKGIVTEYDLKVLNHFNIYPENPVFGIQKTTTGPFVTPIIENELNFFAVNSTYLPFDTISIYLSKKRTERIKISQGSGFYEINTNENGIISVEFDSINRELIITPIRIGEVRIDILDRCLTTEPFHLYVSIVSIGRIELNMPDRVEKSKYIDAIVKLFDSNNHPLNLDVQNLDSYELHDEIFIPNMLNIRLGGQSDLDVGEVRYIVTGVELGETKVIFNSGKSDKIISSAPSPIQVFPPLKLFPRNITLVVGATVQIYSRGGPYPDVNIVYSVHHREIATMESSVVTAQKLGETIVTGRCIGVNPTTGNQIIFSEDSVHLYVIPLDKIKIKTPLVRIKTGAVMPAFIWGVPDLSPMVLGTLSTLKVFWKTNQPDVIEISGIFSDAGIQYTDEDSISVRIKALNPGKAQIQASIFTSNGIRLQASVEISVFKMLELESPKKIYSDAILIPPHSSIQLITNLEDTLFEVDGGDHSSNIKVSRDGLVKSDEAIGRSLVIATSSDQTLSIPIEVKNVHYILTSLNPTNIKLNSVETKIPQGFSLQLKVTLHDNLGNEFSHNFDEINSLKYKLSRKELVDIKIGGNFSLSVHLLRETSNMLSVTVKDGTGIKYNEDFLKLSVGSSSQVFPIKTTFSVGDIICFDSHLDLSAKWSSSDDSILSIHSDTGVAKVLASRFKNGDKISILQGDKSSGHLKIDVDIKEADKIEFLKTYDIMSGEKYQANLIMKHHLQTDKLTNMITKNTTICRSKLDEIKVNYFTCKLLTRQNQASYVLSYFKVTPIFDKKLGMYSCEITLQISISELNKIIKNNEVNIELEALLPNGFSDLLSLKIIPGITVIPPVLSVEQLVGQIITITGLDKVLDKLQVKSSDKSIVEVIQHTKSSGVLLYKLKLVNSYPDNKEITIDIHSPITLQDIKIPIMSSFSSMKCSTRPMSPNANDFLNYISNFGIIISIVILSAATVGAFMLCLQKPTTSTSDQIFLTPNKSNKHIKDLSSTQNQFPHQNLSFEHQRSPKYSSSPFSGNQSNSQMPEGRESPIYGDTTLISPQRRVNQRYL